MYKYYVIAYYHISRNKATALFITDADPPGNIGISAYTPFVPTSKRKPLPRIKSQGADKLAFTHKFFRSSFYRALTRA